MSKPYYQDSHVTIYHGDCREIAPTLGRFDLLLTDPPYGIGVDLAMAEKSGTQYGKAAAPKSHYVGSGWDDKPVDFETLRIGIDATGKSVIWGGGIITRSLHHDVGLYGTRKSTGNLQIVNLHGRT